MMRAALLAMLALLVLANPAAGAFDSTMEFASVRAAKQITHKANKTGYISRNSHHKGIGHTIDHRRTIGERRGMVTISVASGARITVAKDFAPKIAAFISDLCARGYCTTKINCYAYAGHVRHSRHYAGKACDFNQRGWNKTDGPMYHLRGLAERHGLRDGCRFHDCGHVDDGRWRRTGDGER